MTGRAALLLGALAAGSACGGHDLVLPTRSPAAIDLRAGDGQTAVVGAAVAIRPSVVVRDDGGTPVPGTAVTFTITAGGGSVSGGAQTTDKDGVATAGGWTLGTTAGANRLQASVTSADPVAGNPVTFSATGVPGPVVPANTEATVPNGRAGSATTITVRLRDEFANPVGGAGAALEITVTGANPRSALSITETEAGTYTASYTPTLIGNDAVRIRANGTDVPGSPFTGAVGAGPASPTESVAQVPTNVFLLAPTPIQLETRDQFGNRLGTGGDDVDITAVLGTSRTTLAVTDNGDGTYTASTEDLGVGTYEVEITLNGIALAGSPFPMRVRLF